MNPTRTCRQSHTRIEGLGLSIWLALVAGGCTLAPTVTVPTEDLKEAAADLSSGVKGGAREFGKGVAEGAERYREEIREATKGVTMMAQSANDLVAITRESPVAFSEAMTARLLQDANVQIALKNISGLARSGERFAASAEKAPAMVVSKIGELQEELTKPDGFLTQQRAAIIEEFRKERQAITETIRQERADAMKDLDALTLRVVQEASAQLQKIIGGALPLITLFVLVLWGLPFGAGFLVGRFTRKKP